MEILQLKTKEKNQSQKTVLNRKKKLSAFLKLKAQPTKPQN